MGPKDLEKVIEMNRMRDVLPEEFKGLFLVDGKLSEHGLKSEYERGFVDCWNKLRPLILDRP